MGNIFAGSEIVEMGIQIEKNGRDFYGILAQQSQSPLAKGRFVYLAGEEAKHIMVFQGILDKIGQHQPAESYPGEYFAYMSALAGEYVFTKKDKGRGIARSIKTDKEAVEFGIKFEKDSIIFYEGMKRAVPEFDHKIMENLIAQEQGHLRQLSELKKQL